MSDTVNVELNKNPVSLKYEKGKDSGWDGLNRTDIAKYLSKLKEGAEVPMAQTVLVPNPGRIMIAIVFFLMTLLLIVGLVKEQKPKQYILSTSIFNLGVGVCNSRGGLVSLLIEKVNVTAKCNDGTQIPLSVTVSLNYTP